MTAWSHLAEAEEHYRGHSAVTASGPTAAATLLPRPQNRLVVFTLQGPQGKAVRNAVIEQLRPRVNRVVPRNLRALPQRRSIARQVGADAMVGGRVRCRGQWCRLQLRLYRPDGTAWERLEDRVRRGQVLARAQVLAERLLDLIESTTARPLTNDTDSNTDADGAAGWTEEWGPLPEAMGEPSLILSPSSLGDSTGTDVDPPGRPTAQETEEPLPPEPSLLERPPVRWDALEVSLHGDVTVRRQLCLDLNFVVGADNDHCHLDGPFMDDRANVIGPFGGYGFAVTVFPGMLRRTDSQPWWGHIGFHGEYNRGLSEFDRRPTHKVVLDYRPGGDDPDPPYKIDMVQQDFKLHLLGRVPFPRRQESHLLLALGAGLYQVALDQSDYPDDAKLDREDRPSNPYLPTFTYLTLDLGVTVKVALARWVFPFVSVLGRYGVDKGYYPLSQASRVFGARNNVLAVEGELGLQFRLPRGFRITASGQVLWFRTYYATDNRQRLRTNEQGIWDVDPVFGSRADDLVVRTRLALGWAY